METRCTLCDAVCFSLRVLRRWLQYDATSTNARYACGHFYDPLDRHIAKRHAHNASVHHCELTRAGRAVGRSLHTARPRPNEAQHLLGTVTRHRMNLTPACSEP